MTILEHEHDYKRSGPYLETCAKDGCTLMRVSREWLADQDEASRKRALAYALDRLGVRRGEAL